MASIVSGDVQAKTTNGEFAGQRYEAPRRAPWTEYLSVFDMSRDDLRLTDKPGKAVIYMQIFVRPGMA